MSVVPSPQRTPLDPPPISCHPGSLIPMDDHSEGSLIEIDHASRQTQKFSNKPLRCTCFLLCCATTPNWCDIGQMTIDILPEDVLLVIFDHYVVEADGRRKFEEWQMLVHVCRKWRYAVFRSPLGLNLRILCSAGTSVKEKLAPWPPLPIIIDQYFPRPAEISKCGQDNIIEALGHDDRVCQIKMNISYPLLERVFSAMQKTFLGLKVLDLYIDGNYDRALVVPDSFLGGSAPDLRCLRLTCIPFPFPVLRKLLLSAPNLAILSVRFIPDSGYFSPEAMVTCLSALTRLKLLNIGFEYLQSQPPLEGRRPPLTHSVLPALTGLEFTGAIEYLEDLVSRIDTPLLNRLYIRLKHSRPTTYDTPQLTQFLSRAPKLKAYDEACVRHCDSHASFAVPGRDNLGLHLEISCHHGVLVSFMAQLCTSSFLQVLIPTQENLYILEHHSAWRQPYFKENLKDHDFLDLFRPFTTVKNLYISREFVPPIASALQELVGERVIEVLPNLKCMFLEDIPESGFVPEAMLHFIAARQLSYRPITISPWIWKNKYPGFEVY